MSERKVYLLGGYQTDFKRAYRRNGIDLKALMGEAVDGALNETGIAPEEIQVAHIGNFVAELFCGQGQLGGFFAALHPEFSGLPASRHEGACASGSLAGDALTSSGVDWPAQYLGAAGLRIAGGTDEVLRNIIAERVLDLPREVRADKDIAFKDIPAG